MIILYAITGCVSLLFSIVVILGAVRAIRHPERYGPRPATMGRWRAGEYHPSMHAPPQSRAAGLGRAVLDSFPLIKFGATTPANPYPTYDDEPPQPQKTGDLESAGAGEPVRHEEGMEMDALPPINTAPGAGTRDRRESHASISTADPPPSPSHARSPTSPSADQPQSISDPALPLSSPAEEASAADAANILAQSQIGTETCPICIVDFQNGDDLRVLPCAGRHRFHQACVDPWLLELSSSCPICRADFATLETIVAANTSEEGHDYDGELEPEADPVAGEQDVQRTPAPTDPSPDVPQPLATASTTGGGASARVSRYLRFAQSRRGQGAATRAPR
ncbi:hypothetical protein DL93DRAFT_2081528 [Clavulina sp. PMI_390]|nr:hypothetical protein DL93DRAFT_2081528 [Clavulina sp. PMI_390]